MADSQSSSPGWSQLGVQFKMLGTPAPVFPGFEVDITERVADRDKPDAVWHRDRARRMLAAHPELRELFGQTRSTAAWCILFAGGQVALAVTMYAQPWWLLILVAYLVGSWININLFMLAHECNHGLVFKSNTWNRWLFTLTSLPMFLTGHHAWWIEHPVHHNDLGAKKDFIKRRRTILLVTRRTSPMLLPMSLFMLVMQMLRTLLGLFLYIGSLVRGQLEPGTRALCVLADEHLVSGYRKYGIQRWAVAYALCAIGMMVGLYWYWGVKPLVYLLLSQTFMIGFLHPLLFGMILSNSHFHGFRCYQPSSSYYGWLNKVTFNFGLHTEHHDLAAVPWNRLPAIRRIAPEFYDDLFQTKSYAGLALRFALGSEDDFAENFANENRRNAELIGSEE